MAEDIRLSVGGDTTPLENQIANVARKARVVIQPTIDSRGLDSISRPLGKITGQADEFSKSMEAANARVLAFGASVGVLNAVSQAFKNIVTASTEVEASLKEIQVATGETTKDLEKLGKGIFDIAKSTGLSFKEAAAATLEFSRQGGSLAESLERAKAALVLTRTTGLDAAEAVRGLTAAVKSFNQEGLTYEVVVNKLASVDTKFAVSSRDLIEGISRSASVAQEAGVSFDELTALITTLQEKTARGGAVIGNALKTIFTRVQSSENLDLLRSLGIAVNDVSGNILPATTIIKKLADEFNNLDSVTRKSVLTKIGGGFQIDKLAAVLNDLSEANGTFNQSLKASTDAGNQGYEKLQQLSTTVQASFNRLVLSGSELAANIGKVAFSDDFKKIIDKATSFIEAISESVSGGEEGGTSIGKSIVKGLGSVLTGPGTVLVGALITKLLLDLGKFTKDSIQNQLGVTNATKEQENIQKSILNLLSQNRQVQDNLRNLEGDKAAQAEYLLSIYNKQAQTLKQMAQFSKEITPAIYEAGVRITEGGVKNVKTAAGGFLPNEAEAYMKEKREAPAGSTIIKDDNFPFGNGVRGTMFYNSKETRIKNFANGGDAIIPNYAQAQNKKEVTVNLDDYSVAGLTIGGGGEVVPKSRSIKIKPRGIEISEGFAAKQADPQIRDFLSKVSKLNFNNLNVGNVYRQRNQNINTINASEEQIVDNFIERTNDFLSPRIADFIQQEWGILGITPTKSMQEAIKKQKFNFVNRSMAGSVFESMLKAANMDEVLFSKDWGVFDSEGAFDISNLNEQLASQYGLPERVWKHVEVKSSEETLFKDIGRKFLNQASTPKGKEIKEKLIRTAANGFDPKKLSLTHEIEDSHWGDPMIKASMGENELGYIAYILGEKSKTADIDTLHVEESARNLGISKKLYEELHKTLSGYSITGQLLKQSGRFAYPQLSRALFAKRGWEVEYRDPRTKKYIKEKGTQEQAREMIDRLRALSNKYPDQDLKPELITHASDGYVPNYAKTQNISGVFSRWTPKYANMSEQEVKSSFSGSKGTSLAGTTLAEEGLFGKFNLLENNIIASILGNNAFFSSDANARSGIEFLAKKISAQGQTKSVGNTALGTMRKHAYKEDEVISGQIAGEFKNLKYEKLKDLFPRLWRAKGLGDIWEKTKQALLIKQSNPFYYLSTNYQEKNLDSTIREYTKILRDAAIDSVTKYNSNVSGFNINLSGSEEERFLQENRVNQGSYLSLFSGSGISDFKNLGVLASAQQAKTEARKLELKKDLYRKSGVLYKDFKNNEQYYRSLGNWGNYDSSKKTIYLTSADGYVPNFAQNGALMEAINREQKESKLPLSAIKVVQDSKLMNKSNPNGLAVINDRDEPNGKIPNFADPLAGMNLSQNLIKAIEASGKGLQKFADSIESLSKILNSSSAPFEYFSEALKNTANFFGTSQKEIEDAVVKFSESLKKGASATQNANDQSTKPNPEKEDKGAKEDKASKEVNKTLGDTAAKMLLFQTALSFTTGAISSMGETGQKFAGIIGDVSNSLYLLSQAKDIKSGLQDFAKGQIEKGNTGLGKTLGAVGAAVPYVAAGFAVIKGIDTVNTLIKEMGDGSIKTAENLSKLNEIQKKYTINLSEENKAKSEAFVRKVGSVSAETAYDRLSLTPSFLKSTPKTEEALKKFGFSADLNSELVKSAAQMFQEEVSKEAKMPQNKGKSQISLMDEKVSAYLEQLLKESTETIVSAKKQVPRLMGAGVGQFTPLELRDEEKRLNSEKVFSSLEESLKQAAEKAKTGPFQKFLEESFLVPTNLLKAQINSMSELNKMYAQMTTSQENELNIRKQLLQIGDSEKDNLEFRLKILQAEKESTIQKQSGSVDFLKQQLENAMQLRGTAVGEQFYSNTKGGFEKAIQGIYSGGNIQDILTEQINNIRGINRTDLTEEQVKKFNEYEKSLQNTIEINKINNDLIDKQLQIKKQETAQENLNLAIIKQKNSLYQAQTDALNAQASIREKMFQKEQDSLKSQREIEDALIGASRVGRGTFLDQSRQREQDINRTYGRGIEDIQNAQTQEFIRKRSELVGRLSANPETFDQAKKALNTKSMNELKDIAKEAFEVQGNSLSDRVTRAATDFYEIVNKAGLSFAENASGTNAGQPMSIEDKIDKAIINAEESLRTKSLPEMTVAMSQLKNLEKTGMADYRVDNVTKSISDLSSTIENLKKERENLGKQIVESEFTPSQDYGKQMQARGAQRTEQMTAVEYQKFQETTFSGGVSKSMQSITNDLQTFQSKLGQEIPNGFRDSMLQAMKDITGGSKSIKDSLLSAALSFTQKIQDAFLTRAANKLTASIFGSGESGTTGLGGLLQFSSGGPIKGGSGAADDVPAMLMGGEYVINKKAVNQYGVDFFNKINSGKLKGYASGGLISTQELNYEEYAKNKSKFIEYGSKIDQGIIFNKEGAAVNLVNYKGIEENKADAIKKAQTNYYLATAQTGKGGFMIPGELGAGAIVGQKNLLSFATQQLLPGQENLSLFALRDEGNARVGQFNEAKQKALELYLSGTEAAKQKEDIKEEARKQLEEMKKQMEKNKRDLGKEFLKNLAVGFATSLASSAIGGLMNSATIGQQKLSASKLAETNSGQLTGWEKLSSGFSGMFNASNWGKSPSSIASTSSGNPMVWTPKGWSEMNANTINLMNIIGGWGGVSWGSNPMAGGLYGGGSKISMNLLSKLSSFSANPFSSLKLGGTKSKTNIPRAIPVTQKLQIPFNPEYTIPSEKSSEPFLPQIGEAGNLNLIPYAAGGYVVGNGMGDNVPTMLNGGEFVISKQASQKMGYNNLQKINSGQEISDGMSEEMVSRLEKKFDELIQKGTSPSINIEVNSNGQSKEQSSNEDEKNKQLAKKIKEVVMNVLREEQRLGGVLRK